MDAACRGLARVTDSSSDSLLRYSHTVGTLARISQRIEAAPLARLRFFRGPGFLYVELPRPFLFGRSHLTDS